MEIIKNKPKNIKTSLLKYQIFRLFLLFFLINPYNHICKAQTNTPRLANYFLKWSISDSEAIELSKWDLLILDMENQVNNPQRIKKIRELNPDIKILAYMTMQEIRNNCDSNEIKLRCELISAINESNYLKDISGNKLSFWPGTHLLNITEDTPNSWSNTFPQFIKERIYSTGLWDGFFYDNGWNSISWISDVGVDIDNDYDIDDKSFIDSSWKSATIKMLSKTKMLTGNNFIVAANSIEDKDILFYSNGAMIENFGEKSWIKSMNIYLDQNTLLPNVSIINANTANTGNLNDYKKMRYGLTSALLGNGYFAFDYGDKDHAQLYWYDEYNTKIGNPISNPINLKSKNSKIDLGLWRRDFENATSFVNSSRENQVYIFEKEVFEKIKGTQDAKINSGAKVNYLNLTPSEGVILLKTNQEIQNSTFNNGDFYRVFNYAGAQTRNGFFALKSNFTLNTKILVTDVDNDTKIETISSEGVNINIYNKYKEKISSFYPYDKNFNGGINFVVYDINNDGKNEIITGANSGGSHVRIFDHYGKLISQFFAHDKNTRYGVKIAVSDINNDGINEIITSFGKGMEPIVKIFDIKGNLLTSFLAYDKNFKGGININTSDINNDGISEIITAPASNGGSHIKIFTGNGKLLNQFFAYEKSFKGGFNISINTTGDNQKEILISANK